MAGIHGVQVPEMVIGVVIIDFQMAMDSVVVVEDTAMAADVVVVVVVAIGVDRDRKEGDIKIQVYNFFIQPSCQFLYETSSLILKQFQKS